MPRMSAAAAEGRRADLVHQLSLGTRLVAVVLLPATAAYVVLDRPLAITLFEWRSYLHDQAVSTGWVIAAAGLGLVPFAISQLQLFAFYAMPDTKTPAVINVPVVAVRIALDVLLYVVLPLALVASGLMIGSAVSFVVAAVVGYILLRRRIGPLDLTRVFGTVRRLALAALIAAVPAGLLVYVLVRTWGDSKSASACELVLGSVVLLRCMSRPRPSFASANARIGRHAARPTGPLMTSVHNGRPVAVPGDPVRKGLSLGDKSHEADSTPNPPVGMVAGRGAQHGAPWTAECVHRAPPNADGFRR